MDRSAKTNCCEDASDAVYVTRIVNPKLTSSAPRGAIVIHDKSTFDPMPGAYIPPNRRFRPNQQPCNGSTGGLGITRKPRFDLQREAAAFPTLGGAPARRESSEDGPPRQLASFLEKAALRTEKIRARGRRPHKAKCPIGWVKLPVSIPSADLPAPRPPTQRAYAEAAERVLRCIQRRRDLENEILGPHSKWAEAYSLHEPLTREDDSDLEYWSGSETETSSEDE